MATFTKNYVEATANTPILSSAWNENIYSTQERFQKHDHSEVGDNGPKIGISGLAADVTDKFNDLQALIDTLISRVNDLEAALNKPEITGFDYTSPAHPGDSVDILGVNFDSDPANNTVRFFNGTAIEAEADVTAAAPDRLTVTVPADAKPGKVTVEVGGHIAESPGSIVIMP